MVRMIGFAAAFAPNPNRPPFYGDFQFELVDGNVVPVPEVWKKWLAFDPVALVPSLGDNLRHLRGFKFDCWLSDGILDNSRAFSCALSEANVIHEYEEYDGGHGDRVQERIENNVLPFFSGLLITAN